MVMAVAHFIIVVKTWIFDDKTGWLRQTTVVYIISVSRPRLMVQNGAHALNANSSLQLQSKPEYNLDLD
jgi:hypothetical protein